MAKLLYRFLAILLFISHCVVYGQIPRVITYQGYLTDDLDTPLNGSKTLTFRLYDDATSGTLLWSEEQTVSIDKGLFRALLGSMDAFPDTLSFNKPYWLSVQVEGSAEFAREPLTSVPYSFYSSKADSAKNIPDNIITSSKIKDGTIGQIDLGDNAVTIEKMNDNSVGTSELEDDAVNTDKIAPDAVTGSQILNETVNTIDLADNSISADKIKPDAVASDKISDEPGIAYKYGAANSIPKPGIFILSNSNTNQTVDNLTITTPGAGVVVIEATGYVLVQHTQGVADAIVLNVTTDPGEDPLTTYGASSFMVPINLEDSQSLQKDYRYPFACRRIININSASSLTVYLVVRQLAGANIDKTEVAYPVLMATYYPTTYDSGTTVK